MPELPEVETVVRQLGPLITGGRVRGLEVFDPLLGEVAVELAKGRVVAGVERRGKQIVIELRDARGNGGRAPVWLAVHLRMTGGWCGVRGRGENRGWRRCGRG